MTVSIPWQIAAWYRHVDLVEVVRSTKLEALLEDDGHLSHRIWGFRNIHGQNRKSLYLAL